MKYLAICFLLMSCNVVKTLTDGETDPSEEFYESGYNCNSSSTNDCGNNHHETLYDGLEVFYDFENLGDIGQDISGNGSSLSFNATNFTSDTGSNGGTSINCSNSTGTNNMYSSSSNLGFGTGGNFTISFWARFSPTPTNFSSVIDFEEAGTPYFRVSLSGDTRVQLQLSASSYKFNTTYGTTAWEHYVFVVDRLNGITYYKDGELDNSDANDTTATNLVSDRIMLCGAGPAGTAINILSLIKLDRIGVWNRVLSSEEITRLHSGNSGF